MSHTSWALLGLTVWVASALAARAGLPRLEVALIATAGVCLAIAFGITIGHDVTR